MRIFGEDDATDKAYQEIDDYIRMMMTLREDSILIPIPQGCLRQCIEKANELRELGNEKRQITIDIPKRLITISGDKQSVVQCEQAIIEFLEKHRSDISEEKKTSLCPMCMCEFDSPYSLQECGHIFCRSCLMNYFESYMNSMIRTDTLKLCCPLNRCGVVCLIRDIVSIMGAERITHLAMTAFEKYIQNSDNDLARCFEDNCSQVGEFTLSNLFVSLSRI